MPRDRDALVFWCAPAPGCASEPRALGLKHLSLDGCAGTSCRPDAGRGRTGPPAGTSPSAVDVRVSPVLDRSALSRHCRRRRDAGCRTWATGVGVSRAARHGGRAGHIAQGSGHMLTRRNPRSVASPSSKPHAKGGWRTQPIWLHALLLRLQPGHPPSRS